MLQSCSMCFMARHVKSLTQLCKDCRCNFCVILFSFLKFYEAGKRTLINGEYDHRVTKRYTFKHRSLFNFFCTLQDFTMTFNSHQQEVHGWIKIYLKGKQEFIIWNKSDYNHWCLLQLVMGR